MALYADSDYRFILLTSKKVTGGVAFNAAGHALAGLLSMLSGDDFPPFLDYPAGDGRFAVIAKHPVIVLQADNSNQILTCYKLAIEAGVKVNPFVEAMIGASAEAQQAATASLSSDQHAFVALAMFGTADCLKPLTKKFSLMKSEKLIAT